MGTKNNPGDYDCYAAARHDEPVFTLRAHDELAPTIVRIWAIMYLKDKRETTPTSEQDRKYHEALKCAEDMEKWHRKEGERMVTVCDACLQASCWHGLFMCSESQNAGTVDKPVSELRTLNLEHRSNWEPKL